jgi:hypothetical protein
MLCNLYIVAAMLIIASDKITWMDGWTSLSYAVEWTFGKAGHLIATASSHLHSEVTATMARMKDWHVK